METFTPAPTSLDSEMLIDTDVAPATTGRAATLRRMAEATHPALSLAMRRRAAELELQTWLEDITESTRLPLAA